MTSDTARQTLLRVATAQLQAADIPSPLWEARFLLCDCDGITPTDIITYPDHPVDNPSKFQEWVARRASGEPLSRITGQRNFWGLDFKVSPTTLDPRMDSEVLVRETLALIPNDQKCEIADIGTGTGCLLLAILHERPNARGIGLDISAEALATARSNADRLGLADHARFEESNWLSVLQAQSIDVLISNPPYIVRAEIDHLDPAVRNYDPILALDGGPDGLDAYRAIIDAAPKVLRPGGWIALEIGWDQGESVPNLLNSAGFLRISCFKDTSGHDRVVLGQMPDRA
ncbi:MAG: peptide chain release factor N(5)-glutamine methyltransferase [Alphaproteobacteria bacterium]|nr:peptide chain release factor N(5)-glutamine methyltransferase [Alphaproteobacteria bacterium]